MAQVAAVLPVARERFALNDHSVYALLAAVALLLRIRYFGDPALHVDEQFYLLVGDRILDGAWPYVDIWDRKPVGLFIIYAGIRLLGGSGILAYQLVATAFAAATAAIIYRIARLWAPTGASLCAGAAYLASINLFQGWGGQSPIFYNLLVAGAALATLAEVRRAAVFGADPAAIVRHGACAMVLFGLAIQIKYTALPEGMALGLLWLWCLWRASRRPAGLLAAAVLWIAIALAPTALAWGVYAAKGHGEAFVYANFISIFDKVATVDSFATERLRRIVTALAPMILMCALAALKAVRTRSDLSPSDRATLCATGVWFAAAIGGFALVGNFYFHYTLPLLVPLCVVAFWGLPPGRIGSVFAMALIAMTGLRSVQEFDQRERTYGQGGAAFAMAEAIRPHLRGGSLFVFDGPPVLYLLTGASSPTRFPFPYHLNMALEAPALGVDTDAEMRGLLATRPDVIVTGSKPVVKPNRPVWRMVGAELARHYREVARIRYGKRDILIYASSTGRTS